MTDRVPVNIPDSMISAMKQRYSYADHSTSLTLLPRQTTLDDVLQEVRDLRAEVADLRGESSGPLMVTPADLRRWLPHGLAAKGGKS